MVAADTGRMLSPLGAYPLPLGAYGPADPPHAPPLVFPSQFVVPHTKHPPAALAQGAVHEAIVGLVARDLLPAKAGRRQHCDTLFIGPEKITLAVANKAIGIDANLSNVFFDSHGVSEFTFTSQEFLHSFDNPFDQHALNILQGVVDNGAPFAIPLVGHDSFADSLNEQTITCANRI